MMGPMGTRLGVLAGELWLVAGEDTGDDSLLSEDPVEREHKLRAMSPPCCTLCPHFPNSRILTAGEVQEQPGREGPTAILHERRTQ